MAKIQTLPSVPAPDFQLIFEAAPGPCLLLDTNFVILNATNSYLEATMRSRESLIGKHIFDAFPDNPNDPQADGVHNLNASLKSVLSTGKAHTMAVQKYDIRKPENKGGGFEVRYWSPHNAPVLAPDGTVACILHTVTDVTDFINMPNQTVTETNISPNNLIESQFFLKNILDTVVDPIFVKDRKHRLIVGNNALWTLFGKKEEEVLGKSDYDFFPKEEADVFWQKDEEVFNSEQVNVNIENFTDGTGKKHIISTKKACFTTARGEKILVGVIRDITDLLEMQDRLKQSDEGRLKAIMDHSGCVVYIKDLDGRYLQANKDLLQLLRQPEEDILGKTDYDFFPAEHADVFRRNDQMIIENGSAMEFEETAPHQEGVHTYRTVKFPLYDANNKIYAICGLSSDITDRKKAEEAAALLASIVASSDDAIISKTLNGIITSWNNGAEKLFGYTASEAIGQSIKLIIPSEHQDEEDQLITQLKNGKPIKAVETQRVTKSGKHIHISLTVSPIYNAQGQIIGASKVARDISQRKQVEEQLLRYTWELERSNQELDDFAYIASHDLKEPLRGVFNHASFLLEDYGDKLNEDGVHRLNRLSTLAQRMEYLINDLLYFSRLGRTQLAIRETNLNTVVEEIKQMLDGVLHEKNVKITINGTLPNVVCDRPRITEALRNLITNAVKYNDKAERLIEVGYLPEIKTKRGIEKNVYYVKDNGMGIADEFHQEIFRIFKRLNKPANEKEAGTGVGLTFVKKIIERHNGTIWLESELGKGTTFYFTIGNKTA